jgi:hypothetical protein
LASDRSIYPILAAKQKSAAVNRTVSVWAEANRVTSLGRHDDVAG